MAIRVIVLGQPETSLPDSTIEQAWQLVDAVGRHEANMLVVDGINGAPDGRSDVVDGWVALAQGIDALAHATRH